MLTPSTCSHSQASLFPGLQKAGWGPGNEAMHSLSLMDGWARDYLLTGECNMAYY